MISPGDTHISQFVTVLLEMLTLIFKVQPNRRLRECNCFIFLVIGILKVEKGNILSEERKR